MSSTNALPEAKETERRIAMGLCWAAFESLVRMERAYGACDAAQAHGCNVTSVRKAQRSFEKFCVRERVTKR